MSKDIEIVATNVKPNYPCIGKSNTCTNTGTMINTMTDRIYCDDCKKKRQTENDNSDEDDNMYSELCNSPRNGVCGYTGNGYDDD